MNRQNNQYLKSLRGVSERTKKHLLDNGMHDLLDVVELGILRPPRT